LVKNSDVTVPGIFPGNKGGQCIGLTITNFTCWWSWNLGASTSCNPLGLNRPVWGLLHIFRTQCGHKVMIWFMG
jgi:hypothetical protein